MPAIKKGTTEQQHPHAQEPSSKDLTGPAPSGMTNGSCVWVVAVAMASRVGRSNTTAAPSLRLLTAPLSVSTGLPTGAGTGAGAATAPTVEGAAGAPSRTSRPPQPASAAASATAPTTAAMLLFMGCSSLRSDGLRLDDRPVRLGSGLGVAGPGRSGAQGMLPWRARSGPTGRLRGRSVTRITLASAGTERRPQGEPGERHQRQGTAGRGQPAGGTALQARPMTGGPAGPPECRSRADAAARPGPTRRLHDASTQPSSWKADAFRSAARLPCRRPAR